MKWAQSADGFIDAKRSESAAGKPLQISNPDSKKLLHQWRSEEQAIMVGTNTALLDNPQLTVREVKGINPLRITIDKWLRIPKEYHLFDKSTPTLVFTATEAVSSSNLEYMKIDFEKAIVPQILKELRNRNINSLLVEGGEQLLNSFISADMWDEARIFVSEKKIKKGVNAPHIKMDPVNKKSINEDILLTYINH
ncbi:MAG: RibD family protein [Bacteroidota bacterium]